MKQTKPYITLRDRMWKNKEWYTSFRSHKNIRKLTEEEAKSLSDIEEVILKKEPISGVVGEDRGNGRMFCLKCGNQKGFYVYKMHRGEQNGWYQMFTCPDCGEREKRMLY